MIIIILSISDVIRPTTTTVGNSLVVVGVEWSDGMFARQVRMIARRLRVSSTWLFVVVVVVVVTCGFEESR